MPTIQPDDKSANATEKALSPAQLAARWGCCRQSIYNAISDGELHSFKFRNRRLISLSEVERIERGDS
jgi:excisionase family DNA binding protein